jgi:hypothetical protein
MNQMKGRSSVAGSLIPEMIRVEFAAYAPARQPRSQPTNLSAMIDLIFGDVKPKPRPMHIDPGRRTH